MPEPLRSHRAVTNALPAAPLARRELLRLGAVSILAGAAPTAARAADAETPVAGTSSGDRFGQAQGCIFLLLQGGPSHLDLWDPKPKAPDQVRGPFETIETRTPGLRLGQMLPETAKRSERLLVVRSMTHRFANHIAGTYITLTGSEDQPDADREAKADDFPGPGAVLNYLQASSGAAPASVSLPTWLSIPGPSNRMPGQYAGFLGTVYDPFLIAGEPQKSDFRPLSLSLPDDFSSDRLAGRWSLRQQLDDAARRLEPQATATVDRLSHSAYALLTDPRVRDAVDLSREPEAVRERYGKTKIGQSLLLARRLIEAGVRLVSYNAFNQEWDTHGGLKGRYEHLIPPMDQAYAALLDDLSERGLIDQTLVVHCGEFGRTPLINKDAGRDHWPWVYSVALAGGGIRGGEVYGASDSKGAYVAEGPVSPADLLATVWHLMGINPATALRDRLGRTLTLCHGSVVRDWL